jgi:hypothetical protein
MHRIVNDEALDALFRRARAPEIWHDRPVGDTLLRAVAELVNCAPNGDARGVRLAFVKSAAARKRLAAAASPAGENAFLNAPVIAIVAQPRERDAAPPRPAGMRLAAAALIFAARALGLDCRPVWEVDTRRIGAAFFSDGANAEFLCVLGYGADADASLPPQPSTLHETCEIL